MQETDKQRDERLKYAERAHDRNWKALEIHNKQIEAFSVAAMRAPALVAAGGVAALLGFYSANHARFSIKPDALSLFNASLTWLLIGLLFTLLAPGFAYFSQLAYFDSVNSRDEQLQSPFTSETRRSKIAKIVGDVCRWTSVLLVVASIVGVGVGGLKFLALVAML